MIRPAVVVDRVAKRYRIPHPNAPRVGDYVRRPGWARRQPRTLEVMALNRVSFEVHEGEVFGIIGRNGAGKSTLLKILSRITHPTAGRAEIAGRVASLLEVGTGFHPDLTGRENVFLNGMLLGMPSREVERALPAILEFAGISDYLDTPIKRYSSGMQLRLAFAVAAHLAADTMIIDEVLAVGDAEFQARCTKAMRSAADRGRTTLFVSHNMAAVEKLCSRAILLQQGRVVAEGPAAEVVRTYLREATGDHGGLRDYVAPTGHADRAAVRIARAMARAADGESPVQGEDLVVTVELDVREHVRNLQLWIGFATEEGSAVAAVNNADYRLEWSLERGSYRVNVRMSNLRLLPQRYTLSLKALNSTGDVFDEVPDALSFPLLSRDVLGSGVPLLADRGVTWLPAEFSLLPLVSEVGTS